MIRQVLVYLKRQYNTSLLRFSRLAGAVLLASLIGGFLLDGLAPFTGLWNVARSFVLVPLTASLFSGAYLGGYYLHERKLLDDPAWVPFRLRFSLTWRRRIALIVAAFVLVFMYATLLNPGLGYTLMASLYLVVAIALLAFIRPTHEEAIREDLDLPDDRDLHYAMEVRDKKHKRDEAREARRQKRTRLLYKEEEPREAPPAPEGDSTP